MDYKNINEINEDTNATDCDMENDESTSAQKIIKARNVVNTGKKVKRGIIYLSTIPKYMNITMIREIFSAYGKVGRVYLQLAENG